METNQCQRLLNSKAKFNRAAQPEWGRVASELDKQVTRVSRDCPRPAEHQGCRSWMLSGRSSTSTLQDQSSAELRLHQVLDCLSFV